MNQLDRYLELCSRIRVLSLELRAAEAEKRLIEMEVATNRLRTEMQVRAAAERNHRLLCSRPWRGIVLLPVVWLCVAATFAPVPQPTPTRMALKMAVRLPAKTNGNFVVAWKPGDPPQTYVTNETTATGYFAGTNVAVGFNALLGSSNKVTAANTYAGQWASTSIVITNVPQPNPARPVLTLDTLQIVRLTWTANTNNAGRLQRLLESPAGSLVGPWASIYQVTPTNGQRLEVWRTNIGGARFYRVYLP